MPDQMLIERVCRFADARGAGDSAFQTEIDGFAVVRGRSPTAFDASLYSPLLCLILQGSKESYVGDEHITFEAGHAVIASLDVPSIARVTDASVERPYVALALAIDLGIIRELFAELCPDGAANCRARPVACGQADEALVEAMGRLFDLVERPLERRVLAPLIVREIHFRLMLADHGGMLRRLSERDSHASRIERALARIRRDFAKPVKVAELAELASMSLSTFHEHFKALTSTSPLQYQKAIRLLEARRRLSTGTDTVSTVAFEVGYESPTQFSREYSRKFGVPPREDRRATVIEAVRSQAA